MIQTQAISSSLAIAKSNLQGPLPSHHLSKSHFRRNGVYPVVLDGQGPFGGISADSCKLQPFYHHPKYLFSKFCPFRVFRGWFFCCSGGGGGGSPALGGVHFVPPRHVSQCPAWEAPTAETQLSVGAGGNGESIANTVGGGGGGAGPGGSGGSGISYHTGGGGGGGGLDRIRPISQFPLAARRVVLVVVAVAQTLAAGSGSFLLIAWEWAYRKSRFLLVPAGLGHVWVLVGMAEGNLWGWRRSFCSEFQSVEQGTGG